MMPKAPPVHGQDQTRQRRREYDQQRGSARERGYTWGWEKYRKGFLAEHPSCVQCKAEGIVTPATVVDHITPHRGDDVLFWDGKNHQPLCETHHNRKTARGA